MDADIYALVAKYGFKGLHVRLMEIMRDEFTYFQTQFQTTPVSPPPIQLTRQINETSKKKVRKTKVIKTPIVTEDVSLSLENTEIKDVIVTLVEKPNSFRDPKEMKEYQKNAVETKKKENDAVGIQPSDVLTKENLKLWIEDEGHTYAWVAREKAGCPETQVAATAKMMGLTSRITKKLGRAMTGN